jgi:hypothetical protein
VVKTDFKGTSGCGGRRTFLSATFSMVRKT